MTPQHVKASQLRAAGWRTTGQTAQHSVIEGDAIVFSAMGCVAVLYPDGTYDRSTAQVNGKLGWRFGWVDQAAVQRTQQKQQQEVERLARLCFQLSILG